MPPRSTKQPPQKKEKKSATNKKSVAAIKSKNVASSATETDKTGTPEKNKQTPVTTRQFRSTSGATSEAVKPTGAVKKVIKSAAPKTSMREKAPKKKMAAVSTASNNDFRTSAPNTPNSPPSKPTVDDGLTGLTSVMVVPNEAPFSAEHATIAGEGVDISNESEQKIKVSSTTNFPKETAPSVVSLSIKETMLSSIKEKPKQAIPSASTRNFFKSAVAETRKDLLKQEVAHVVSTWKPPVLSPTMFANAPKTAEEPKQPENSKKEQEVKEKDLLLSTNAEPIQAVPSVSTKNFFNLAVTETRKDLLKQEVASVVSTWKPPVLSHTMFANAPKGVEEPSHPEHSKKVEFTEVASAINGKPKQLATAVSTKNLFKLAVAENRKDLLKQEVASVVSTWKPPVLSPTMFANAPKTKQAASVTQTKEPEKSALTTDARKEAEAPASSDCAEGAAHGKPTASEFLATQKPSASEATQAATKAAEDHGPANPTNCPGFGKSRTKDLLQMAVAGTRRDIFKQEITSAISSWKPPVLSPTMFANAPKTNDTHAGIAAKKGSSMLFSTTAATRGQHNANEDIRRSARNSRRRSSAYLSDSLILQMSMFNATSSGLVLENHGSSQVSGELLAPRSEAQKAPPEPTTKQGLLTTIMPKLEPKGAAEEANAKLGEGNLPAKENAMAQQVPKAQTKPTPQPATRPGMLYGNRQSLGDLRRYENLHESCTSVNLEDENRILDIVPISQRNSTNYTPIDVKAALKEAPASKWKVETFQFSGRYDCQNIGKWEEVKGKRIDKGIKKFKSNPVKYVAIMYSKAMRFAHNTKNCSYTLIHREGTSPITPLEVNPDGKMTMIIQNYVHLTEFPNNELPEKYRDPWTRDLLFDGERLPPPLLPGRGMGVGDTPNLKIIGDIDPADIAQGDIGNCWLLSAISALAEFDGAIKKLFRKTKFLDYMPLNKPNKYTVSLFDVTTWKEVDIEMDESLCAHPTKKLKLLGAQISEDGELWVCYLEKAFIIHCGGGWDALNGGHCTHAWSMMTGCKEQYFIRKNRRTGKYYCSGKYDMFTGEWKKLHNLPRHEDTACLESVPWPEVGGGGLMGSEVTKDELFMKMYAWDQANYIVGASSKGALEEDTMAGMVQNHSYSVIDALHNVAGTGIDMFCVRNPWGHGEPEEGLFHDTGPGWVQYPEIKAELNPVVADDGIFYLSKDEFFEFFDHVYLSASNMTEFKED